jgi:hypothetical protein
MKRNKTGSRWDGIREKLITNMTNRRTKKKGGKCADKWREKKLYK